MPKFLKVRVTISEWEGIGADVKPTGRHAPYTEFVHRVAFDDSRMKAAAEAVAKVTKEKMEQLYGEKA